MRAVPNQSKDNYLSDNEKADIKRKLKDKFIKVHGYEKKIIIDDELEQFFENKKEKLIPDDYKVLERNLKIRILKGRPLKTRQYGEQQSIDSKSKSVTIPYSSIQKAKSAASYGLNNRNLYNSLNPRNMNYNNNEASNSENMALSEKYQKSGINLKTNANFSRNNYFKIPDNLPKEAIRNHRLGFNADEQWSELIAMQDYEYNRKKFSERNTILENQHQYRAALDAQCIAKNKLRLQDVMTDNAYKNFVRKSAENYDEELENSKRQQADERMNRKAVLDDVYTKNYNHKNHNDNIEKYYGKEMVVGYKNELENDKKNRIAKSNLKKKHLLGITQENEKNLKIRDDKIRKEIEEEIEKNNKFIKEKNERENKIEEEQKKRKQEVEKKINKVGEGENLMTIDEQKRKFIENRFQAHEKESASRYTRNQDKVSLKKKTQMASLKAALEKQIADKNSKYDSYIQEKNKIQKVFDDDAKNAIQDNNKFKNAVELKKQAYLKELDDQVKIRDVYPKQVGGMSIDEYKYNKQDIEKSGVMHREFVRTPLVYKW